MSDCNQPAQVGSHDGLGPVAEAGYFGSMFRNVLVFSATTGPYWYVLVVDDEALRWGLYCNDASIVPAHSGEITPVECLGKKFDFPCWRVHRNNYVSESITIASLPQVAGLNVAGIACRQASR